MSIDKGLKVYKAIEVVGGKPTVLGWRTGKEVQRTHQVLEREGHIFVVRREREREMWGWWGRKITPPLALHCTCHPHPHPHRYLYLWVCPPTMTS